MLTVGHKEFIKSAIDYLFDFENTLPSLNKQISLLKEALREEVGEDHDFYALRKFLKDPQATLTGLEKLNANDDPKQNPSIGEVQTAILEVAFTEINYALANCKLSQASINSEMARMMNEIREESLSLIKDENFKVTFATTKPITPSDAVWPWELMRYAGSAFYSSLKIEENLKDITLFIRMEIDELSYEYKHLYAHLPAIEENINSFMMSIKDEALERSAKIVHEQILHRLRQKNLTSAYAETIALIRPIHLLTTNQYYLQLLFADKINLFPLTQLDESTINSLLQPIAIQIQKDNILDFEAAQTLKEDSLKAIHIYYNFILEKKIPIFFFQSLSPEQIQIFILPVISNLITQQFLSFQMAAAIPVLAKPFLISALYNEYIAKHPIDWKVFTKLTRDHFDFLLQPSIAILIKNNIFNVTDVYEFSSELLLSIKRKNIYSLLLSRKASINQILNLTLREINFLDTHDLIIQALLNETITLKDIKPDDINHTYFLIFSRRLVDFIENPLTNNPFDFESLIKDIHSVEKELEPSVVSFIESINALIINTIEIKIIVQHNLSSADSKILEDFTNLLHNLKQNQHLTNRDKLYHVIIFAEGKLKENNFAKKRYRTRGSVLCFFNNEGDSLESACKIFCEKIIKFKKYLQYLPAIEVNGTPRKIMTMRR